MATNLTNEQVKAIPSFLEDVAYALRMVKQLEECLKTVKVNARAGNLKGTKEYVEVLADWAHDVEGAIDGVNKTWNQIPK